ncbi:MAG: sulfate adenylyltransferase, partial [Verrucomicrobiota bacterium]|nr:sulfate adenylyltransferase [Verrucomicrobiota bacterium]
IDFIPISALLGDNVVDRSENMDWYKGSPLLYTLETVYIGNEHNHVDARFPVQWVIRPHSDEHHDFRGYAGRVAGGVFKPGDEVTVLPSGFQSRIKGVHTIDGDLEQAYSPMSVSLTLEDEIDISRGDMIVKQNNPPESSQRVEAMLVWFSSEASLVERGRYSIRHTTNETKCLLKEMKYKVDINSLRKIEGDREVRLNDIARVSLQTSAPIHFDRYRRNRATGSFVLVDEQTNNTVAAGMIVG